MTDYVLNTEICNTNKKKQRKAKLIAPSVVTYSRLNISVLNMTRMLQKNNKYSAALPTG